ncbi:MAG: hypothetical protein HQL15_05960 [Candidatus Omnitrophica bacterium]|nr:hypothetical protein [Candidatus Omnitrophota bacterium]
MAKRKLDFRSGEAVKLPNGRTIKISHINHPGPVLIAPFLNKDTLVTLKHFRPALKKYIYELPAGTLNPIKKIV